MPDTFIPLVPPEKSSRDGAASAALLGVTPSKTTSVGHFETCAKPVIKVQRSGELVSSIRIECGCGQVIELACIY